MYPGGKRRIVRASVLAGLMAAPLALGACGDEETPEAGGSTPDTAATTMASSPEASPEIGDITDDYFSDASYLGKTVTVEGTVTQVVGESAFVLDGIEYGDENLLVVSAPAMDVTVGEKAAVTGVVREFGFDTYAGEYQLGEDVTAYTGFAGEEFLVAGGTQGSPAPSTTSTVSS